MEKSINNCNNNQTSQATNINYLSKQLGPWASILGVATPRFWGGDCGVMGSPWNIISYNVQEYEMKTLSKVVPFQK